MSTWSVLLIVWLLSALIMLAGWQWQRRWRNAGIVDVLWATSLAAAAVLVAALGDGAPGPRILLGLLGCVWGLRLAWHLSKRVRLEGEDGRYRELRSHWHDDQRRWLGFFQLQALSVALLAIPFAAVAANPRTSPLWLAAGSGIWLLGVLGEAVADAQLASFRADPGHRGRTCRIGLWRYCRHPNYFFEWLHWLAYVAFAVGSPLWGLSWLGPLLMFVFLRFISGIPWTEAQALRTRGEDYREYQRCTSMLFPWFPKRSTDLRS
jgi:steroid 5-alpha reductase family enzyme